MASNRWASGSIAGVALVDAGSRDLRVDILDGEAFHSAMVGSSVEALDLTVHTQIMLTPTVAGIHYGLHIAQLEMTKLAAILAAINAAISGGGTFNVTVADAAGVDTINCANVPDFAAQGGALFKRQAIAAGYVKDVVFRFIAIS